VVIRRLGVAGTWTYHHDIFLLIPTAPTGHCPTPPLQSQLTRHPFCISILWLSSTRSMGHSLFEHCSDSDLSELLKWGRDFVRTTVAKNNTSGNVDDENDDFTPIQLPRRTDSFTFTPFSVCWLSVTAYFPIIFISPIFQPLDHGLFEWSSLLRIKATGFT
jgi:hypothetical protein